MNDVVHLVAAVICIRSNLSKVSRNVRRRPNPGVAHTVIASIALKFASLRQMIIVRP